MFPQQCGSFGSALIPLQRIDFPIDEYDELNSRSAPSMMHINMAKFRTKFSDINRHKSNMAPLSMDPQT